MKVIKFITPIILAAALVGCASTTLEQQFKGMTSQQIFLSGEKALAKRKYAEAVKSFEGLETLYPFGPYAEQGQKDLIYAYYKNGDTASAIAAADRFIHLYPQSANVDYAYYMKGLVNFERGRNWLQDKFKEDPSENDLSYMRQSFINFNELLQRFPNSQYSGDAQKHMIFTRNLLAQHELATANFYMAHKAYVAAANRATFIVEHFQGAPQVISALAILVKANRALGLDKPANEALQVLQASYPNSPQYKALR